MFSLRLKKEYLSFFACVIFATLPFCAIASRPFSPMPNPIYVQRIDIDPIIFDGEIRVMKIEHEEYGSKYRSEWYLFNGSDKHFFILYHLNSGFEWKEISKLGVLPLYRLSTSSFQEFRPDEGGWADSDFYSILISRKKGLGVETRMLLPYEFKEEADGYRIYDLNVYHNGELKEIVLRVKEKDYVITDISFTKNPIESLVLKKGKDNEVGLVRYYFDVLNNESIIFTTKYDEKYLQLQSIPKEYFPREGLSNNRVVNFFPRLPQPYIERKIILYDRFESNLFGVGLGVIDHQKYLETWPADFSIPSDQQIEIPIMLDKAMGSIKARVFWEKNDDFLSVESQEEMSRKYSSETIDNFPHISFWGILSALFYFLKFLILNLVILYCLGLRKAKGVRRILFVVYSLFLTFVDEFIFSKYFHSRVLSYEYIYFWKAIIPFVGGWSLIKFFLFLPFLRRASYRWVLFYLGNFLFYLSFVVFSVLVFYRSY